MPWFYGRGFVKMSFFAIDFSIEMPYPLAPPQGWKAFTIFENLAVSQRKTRLEPQRTRRNTKGMPEPHTN
jgi:hypothetical protein